MNAPGPGLADQPRAIHVTCHGGQVTFTQNNESVTLTDAELWRRRELVRHGPCFYEEFKDQPIPTIQEPSRD